jgi:methyl-accepting chemotaxis protein
LSYVTGFEPWGWVIGTGVYIDDLQAQLWDSAKTVIMSALLVILLLGAVTLTMARRMSGALIQMTSSLAELGNGNFDIVLPGLDRNDELGDMARSIAQFQVKADEKARATALLEEERRLGTEQTKARALQKMAETVEGEAHAAVGEVSSGTSRMAESAILMSESALTLETNSSSVAAAAEEALANAQSVAKASVQLASTISEISGQVASSRKITIEAVAAATQAQAIIGSLSEAAGKVDTVTNLISEIASQTNLLALNATIEAARAGRAGRGFAVVASEVKSLAEQTVKATSEIAQQISEIQETTQASVAAINLIGSAIRNVESITSVVATAIDHQSTVTMEISRTVEETALAAREVATQIVSVSNEAAQTGRRAAEIRDGSEDIARKVGNLRATLVRVIRTSTADVDRREGPRVQLDRRAVIRWHGRSAKVTVCDISSGAAMIEGCIADMAVDTPITHRWDCCGACRQGGAQGRRHDITPVQFVG